MDESSLSSEEIALRYLEQLPWQPYPFQEQAILSWFEDSGGILVCAPTGTGKTVIAETALYEALLTRRRAYYTTPLIALTDQKFHELQESAVRWGFSADDVGLVTGNRKVNPDAPILVVVAEILLNRLLSPDEFEFRDVSAVVMDEFHSFNDPERGIVWELSLGLLPKHVRLLLISATVGNAPEFVVWLSRQHGKTLRLLQSTERKVPLDFRWVEDQLLPEQLELMAEGPEDRRYTPALVFCFNRSECWSVAEQLKGRQLLAEGQQAALNKELDRLDWSVGVGGKLRQILMRGVGIHHAGLLPRYRRAVEKLFQKKLLSVCVCTETLAAGINLPARSVVMTSLLKGPPRQMKLIDASSAHQMFGRAGRPQFDDRGYVFAVAHDDDVKLFRWQQKYDEIPEDTKDPMLRRAKKNLKKKMPKRRDGQQYWSEKQFETLQNAPPGKLASRGHIPWRLLAFLILKSGAFVSLQDAVRRRLLDSDQKERAEKTLKRMLQTLDAGGFVTLQPAPPWQEASDDESTIFNSTAATASESLAITELTSASGQKCVWQRAVSDPDTDHRVHDFSSRDSSDDDVGGFGDGIFGEMTSPPADSNADKSQPDKNTKPSEEEQSQNQETQAPGLLGQLISEAREHGGTASTRSSSRKTEQQTASSSGDHNQTDTDVTELADYEPEYVLAKSQLDLLFRFRSINSIYALFLAEHMHRANHVERLLLLEAALDMPGSVAKLVRVPFDDVLPTGPLANDYLNQRLLSEGLATQEELTGYRDETTGRRIPPLMLADKMRLIFRSEFPGIHDVRSTPVWCIGDLLQFGGNFNKYVRSRELTKQEGIVFRHCLRMILLCGEFAHIEPPGIDGARWRSELADLAAVLTQSCREVDPTSTDETLTQLEARQQTSGEITF